MDTAALYVSPQTGLLMSQLIVNLLMILTPVIIALMPDKLEKIWLRAAIIASGIGLTIVFIYLPIRLQILIGIGSAVQAMGQFHIANTRKNGVK